MRFLPLQALPGGPPDIICKASGRRTLATGLGFFIVAFAALMIAIEAVNRDRLVNAAFYVVSMIAFLFAVVSYLSFRRTLDPANWICQVKGESLFLRCTRFWSDRAAQEVRVLELLKSEIAWVQPLKVHWVEDERGRSDALHRWSGGIVHQWLAYLEIGLSPSAATALDALAGDDRIKTEERELIVPGGYVPDQPVQSMKDGRIRVRWGDPISNITPAIESIAPIFSQFTQVRPLQRETVRRFFNAAGN